MGENHKIVKYHFWQENFSNIGLEYTKRCGIATFGGVLILHILGRRQEVCPTLYIPQFHDLINTPMWDCIYCGRECSNKEARRVHIQQRCRERPEWKFSCIYCGKDFQKEKQMKIHKGRWCLENPKHQAQRDVKLNISREEICLKC